MIQWCDIRYRNKRRQNGQDARGIPSFTDTLIETGDFFKKLLRQGNQMPYTEVNKENFNDFVEARVGVRYCDRYRSCDGASQ